MPRPILATIHPQAIRHNLEQVRQAAPDAKLMSMVKANAYGHGLEHAFAGLRATDGFAVLEISEAQRLRAMDWRGSILLIEGVFDARDLEMCSRLGLWHTVHCDQQIDWLAAHKTQVPHRVFLKMNSGMNRPCQPKVQGRTFVHNMMCNRPLNLADFHVPFSMTKAYELEGVKPDGERVTLYKTENNYHRLNRIPLEGEYIAVRLIPKETWGAEKVHLFAFEVE